MATSSLSALDPYFRLIRRYAEAALLRRLSAGYGFADARIPSETFVHDSDARSRLRGAVIRPSERGEEPLREVAREIADAEQAVAHHDGPLTTLAREFELGPADLALLTIAVAYELDRDVRALCDSLVGPRVPALYPTVCGELATELGSTPALLAALHSSSPLRAGSLLYVLAANDTTAKLGSAIGVSRPVLDWLLGDRRLPAPLDEVVAVYETTSDVYLDPEVVRELDELATVEATAPRPTAVVQGPQGSGKLAAARHLATSLGRPVLATSVDRLIALEASRPGTDPWADLLLSARLRNGAIYLAGIELATGAGLERKLEQWIERAPMLILGVRRPGPVQLPGKRPYRLVTIERPSHRHRQEAWTRALASLSTPELADELAARYVIGPSDILDACVSARHFADASQRAMAREDVEGAVGRRLAVNLGSFATRITRRARMEEMVVPDDVAEGLGDIITMVRERSRILESWGYERHLGVRRGVSALFSGKPGTGKTMAASVISSELGLELFRIDLSSVVSKWVGETEKHLSKIFDEAQDSQAMLLFDEADSLFGKRTEVKSASDRYANLEVNYILQRMEGFDGISILTTNLESAIDSAFMRRINFRIRFPEPEVDERLALWRKLLPPETGLANSEELSALAERFEMTGGHIRNAIVRSAVVAARDGRAMTVDDLFAGAGSEYYELGKVMTNADRGSSS